LLTLCCLLAVPGIAASKVKSIPTDTTLALVSGEALAGTVDSQAKQCVRERTVHLYDLGTGLAFHTTTTDRRGQFSISLADIPPGSSGFEVRAEPARVGSRQCEAGSAEVQGDFVTLSGGPHGGVFTGVLFSSIPACEPGRLISLYEISADPALAGSDLANESGQWEIAQAAGVWQARADALFIRADGAITLCRAVASDPWSFEDPPET
jgi:hypothetical protein